ncbi:MAG: hypothetical protein ACRDT8_27095, partial [Micromonosporaceae bacterium]
MEGPVCDAPVAGFAVAGFAVAGFAVAGFAVALVDRSARVAVVVTVVMTRRSGWSLRCGRRPGRRWWPWVGGSPR